MIAIRVYVAGAYSAPNVIGVLDNMRRGMALSYEVLAVLVVPEGAERSRGTQTELRAAKELDIPVFWSLEELKRWREERAF